MALRGVAARVSEESFKKVLGSRSAEIFHDGEFINFSTAHLNSHSIHQHFVMFLGDFKKTHRKLWIEFLFDIWTIWPIHFQYPCCLLSWFRMQSLETNKNMEDDVFCWERNWGKFVSWIFGHIWWSQMGYIHSANKHSTWYEAFLKGNSSSNPIVSGALLVSGRVDELMCLLWNTIWSIGSIADRPSQN